tara:strand:- start:22 stop:663 length:642 start_codon:yes stop_codon:yes gene_type:complete
MIEQLEIVDDVKSLDEAIELLSQYGEVLTGDDIPLPSITVEETTKVTNQIWHQDGLQTENQPKVQALWCEYADEECPSTEYLSTRIPDDIAEKYLHIKETYDFKTPIESGNFVKFDKLSHAKLYVRQINNTPNLMKNLIDKDEWGYYTRWCPMSKVEENIAEELSDYIFQQEPLEVHYKTNRLVIGNNYATIHRRTPNKNISGKRILHRAYVY